MVCPKCNSENVNVQIEQVSSKTKKHGNGFGGIVNNTARAATAVCTLGMSNLVWKKSNGGEKLLLKTKKSASAKIVGILGIYK